MVVSNRATFRYLLFDENNNLQGWVNVRRIDKRIDRFDENNNLQGWVNEETGKIKSLYSNFNRVNHKKLAFLGIQVISANAI